MEPVALRTQLSLKSANGQWCTLKSELGASSLPLCALTDKFEFSKIPPVSVFWSFSDESEPPEPYLNDAPEKVSSLKCVRA